MLPLIIICFFLLPTVASNPVLFEEQIIDSNITIGYGIALGDVDGDGKPDILLADKKQFVWYRNGDWKKFVLAENLSQYDNVCIAARDITGDGKVEIAVGAQWNPSETNDPAQSGSVHYLIRPSDPTQLWKAVRLNHEPTVHRMKWLRSARGKFYLLVVPLHGRGNVNGEGQGVKVITYEFPDNVNGKWLMDTVCDNMHLTHNFDISESADKSKNGFFLAGKEGVLFINDGPEKYEAGLLLYSNNLTAGVGEVRAGNIEPGEDFIATIEPMHGDKVVVYLMQDPVKRIVIDDDLKEGHALAVADFFGTETNQVIAGWRSPNRNNLTGIKIYKLKDGSGSEWEPLWLDKNGIACEDLQVMDLNQDGKPDVVASGRATHNVKIYWNKTR